MNNMKVGFYYDAVITEWDDSQSHIKARNNGNGSVSMLYEDEKVQVYKSSCGELVQNTTYEYIEHTVSWEYFKSLNPVVLGLAAFSSDSTKICGE